MSPRIDPQALEPIAQVGADDVEFLRFQADGTGWPVGTKMYLATDPRIEDYADGVNFPAPPSGFFPTDDHGKCFDADDLYAFAAATVALNKKTIDVDDLAQAIRAVDGRHALGAGALAEALLPMIERCLRVRAVNAISTNENGAAR